MFRKKANQKRLQKGVEIEDSIMTVTEKEKTVIEMPFERRPLNFIWYVIILAILVLIGRVFHLSFFRGDYYAQISKNNRVRNFVIKAPRGVIFDKHGKVLAKNIPSIDAILLPEYLPEDTAARKKMASDLAEILEMNSGNAEIILDDQDRTSLNPVLLKENITQEQALVLAERKNDFPGVELDKTAIRSYEDGMIFSHIIGYDGKITSKELKEHPGYLMTDYIGKDGLEKSYESQIRGTYGATQVEVNSLGKIKRILGVADPVPGDDLILNIDSQLQKKIYDGLAEVLQKTDIESAAAVAIDPGTGGVLALVSIPGYDNNLFARGIKSDEYKNLISDSNLPLFNRAANGEYPPGSTIKPAIAAGALSEGVITPSTILSGLGGALYVGSWRFGDWKTHGPSDVRMAIAESNDIFFYTIGGGYGNVEGLGMSRMKKYDNLFGFGLPTGIDLPQEAAGFIPNEQWKLDKFEEKWYIGDSYHAAIGQGYVSVTPLQLANYTAAIANGGTLYQPQIVNRVRTSDSQEQILSAKVIRHNFISSEIMQVVREGMRRTVTDGTAQLLQNLPVEAAGKTGTAQFGTQGKTHSWFISFAPYDNPEIALAVILPGSGESNSSAVPVSDEILKWYFGRGADEH